MALPSRFCLLFCDLERRVDQRAQPRQRVWVERMREKSQFLTVVRIILRIFHFFSEKNVIYCHELWAAAPCKIEGKAEKPSWDMNLTR